ncbi:SagB family peptide dehydrogenase [Pseudalkalibacillus sp. A8]|uniref:SagB family peptide dehydrogenase n=1 Tax=Pseudalkalibacillus sp. A8 TaxID=3382641 RepID=UPI0038B42174
MNLDEFLHNLHYDIDQVKPPDFDIDWEDAPLPYKLYRDLPTIPLSTGPPLTEPDGKTEVSRETIGQFLWHAYGLSQLSESIYMDSSDLLQQLRRFVPSGGGLYPNEVYVYLKVEGLADGVYHFDAAHHRLVMLREGNYDSYLNQSLGERCDVKNSFGAVFVTTMFWKNFFKYNNFAYRLQGLDAGALIGQLLELGKRFGYSSYVFFQFLDRAVNHLLGVNGEEESVYAVIPLSLEPEIELSEGKSAITAEELINFMPKLETDHFNRSKNILDYPLITQMNEAAMIDSTRCFSTLKSTETVKDERQNIYLPQNDRLDYDFTTVCRKRYSPDMDFAMKNITKQELSILLQEAAMDFVYKSDAGDSDDRIELYGCFYNVEDIPNGAYRYDSVNHFLELIQPGDLRLRLQSGMTAHNVNLYQVRICLHIVGSADHLKEDLGYRGYRIQQMKAGMLMQRLLLGASALDMGGHPLLGFDVATSDAIYKLDGKSSLIQIPIGAYQPRPWLKGLLI